MSDPLPVAKLPTAKRRRRWLCWLRRLGIAVLLLLVAGWIGLKFVPVPEELLRKPPESIEFTDREGRSLRETSVGQRFRREAAYAEIPQSVVHAALAAEDKRFFSHHGVDWLATGRAAWQSVKAGKRASGASTISQQLVKLSVPRPRTWGTKLIEAATAMRLEEIWTKEEILAAYLNRLDFGNVNYGVSAAANYYFAKPLADLSDAEAALLLGLPLNPARLNPHTNFAGAKKRQETVLGRMLENGWLTRETYERAMAEPIRLAKPRRVFNAPHFVDFVLQSEPVGQGTVRTTLDLELNQFVERVVSDKLARLRAENVHDGAVVVLDNRTGEVLGFVGSEDYFAPGSGQVNGATQARSAGSTIKPVTYLLALERGETLASVLPDVPTEFPTPSGPYRPENYHRHCQGPVRLREALACSLNIPAVRLLQAIGGAAPLQRRLQGWGITTLPKEPEEYGLGLTIGNAEVRLIELANVYATLARFGRWIPVRLLAGGEAPANSRAVVAHRPVPSESMAQRCWLIADVLSDNAARAPAFGAASALRFDFPVACKTGTSTDFRDNWAVGYTPEFTVAVWVGNFNGSPMREVSGVTGAAPILHDVMEYLHRRHGTTWFERPPGIVEREVHPLTGRLVSAGRGEREKFVSGEFPPPESAGDYAADGRVRLGAEYAAWVASGDNHLASQVTVADQTGLHLVSPTPGSTFLIDPDVPTSSLVPLVATGGEGLVWQSPTLRVESRDGKPFARAVEGEHRLNVSDPATGKSLSTWIRVRGL
jgi:penicillin-binding protein 1C